MPQIFAPNYLRCVIPQTSALEMCTVVIPQTHTHSSARQKANHSYGHEVSSPKTPSPSWHILSTMVHKYINI